MIPGTSRMRMKTITECEKRDQRIAGGDERDVAKDEVMPKERWLGNIHRSAGVILFELFPCPHHPRVGNL